MFDDLASSGQLGRKDVAESAAITIAPPHDSSQSSGRSARKPTPVRTVVLPASNPAPPAPSAVAVKEACSNDNPQVESALAIVSEESGIARTDLTGDSSFADIGVDSLLSMVIASRFREELNIQLEADFKLFVDCPTVNELKVFLRGSPDGKHDSTQRVNFQGIVPVEKVSLLPSTDHVEPSGPPSSSTFTESIIESDPLVDVKAVRHTEQPSPVLSASSWEGGRVGGQWLILTCLRAEDCAAGAHAVKTEKLHDLPLC